MTAPRRQAAAAASVLLAWLLAASAILPGSALAAAAEPTSIILDAAAAAESTVIILDAAAAARSDPPWPAARPRRKPTRLAPRADAGRPAEPERSAQPKAKAQPKPKAKARPKRPAGALVASYERPGLPAAAPRPGVRAPREEPLVLHLDWSGSVAAAAFRRGRHLWLVFDAPSRTNIAKQIEKVAPDVGKVEQWQTKGATVLRLVATSGLAPTLSLQDDAWRIDLRPRLGLPEARLAVQVQSVGRRAKVHFAVESAGRLIALRDPDLEDQLHVLPVSTPGLGIVAPRAFPRFRALATYQGIAVVPQSDGLRVKLEDDGLWVTSRSGVLATPEATELPDMAAEATAGRGGRLFDLPAWRRGLGADFQYHRQILQQALVAPAEGRSPEIARIELARFYFAHGLATETRAILDLMHRDTERLARDPQLVLLRAAAALLDQDYDAAARGLGDPILAGEWETTTWRAALAAAAQDWSYAASLFDQAEPLIGDYARPVRVRLRLLAAESRLGIGDTGGASLYLERIREDHPTAFERAQLNYVEGRRFLLDGEIQAALDLWRKVARSAHYPSQARARLALVEHGLETGTLDAAEAIAELERLRFLWRGDEFEAALLEHLAELYLTRGDHRAALHALRQAASHFPDSSRAKLAARRMTDIFVALLLERDNASLPPLRALALYEEFSELTPAGEAGNRVIERLVDRLVEVDLLPRAAELLREQIDERLEGAERAKVGARLALILLLDREPEAAQVALAGSSAKKLPAELTRQRRHLEARALADLGHGRVALERLRGDSSPAGLALRAELLWEQADWPAAALALARLLPETPPAGRPLEPAESRAVLELAIAQTLAGARKALDELARHYGAAMAGTPEAGSFALLASDFDRPDVTALTEELSGVERVHAFIAGYRAQLAEGGLSQVN